jgi:type IV secretion system protein VirB6
MISSFAQCYSQLDSRFRWIICLLILLSGCTGERCIDADDFGFSNVVISSRYTKEELNNQQQGHQVAPWVDSGLKVNGRPLTIVIKTWEYGIEKNKPGELSAWCAWYGGDNNKNTLSRFCERLQPCVFASGDMCTATSDAQITNAPCLFKNGVGLYALIADRGTDPNSSFVSQRSPAGITFHLGEPVAAGLNLYDIGMNGAVRNAGGTIYQYNGNSGLKQQYANSELYFKILDKFYDDNNGQYRIVGAILLLF